MPAGPVEVDLYITAVKQLWPELFKIVRTTNAVVLPFLGLFGAVDGNGVSPFARNFETPNDLIAAINTFFMKPATDPCDDTDINNEEESQESDEENEEANSTDGISTVFDGIS